MITATVKGFPHNIFNHENIYHELTELLPEYDVVYSPASLDVTSKGTNKATGIEKYAKLKGLKLNEFAVFGDSNNDESMLRKVMENKGLAFYVGKKELGKDIKKHPFGYADERLTGPEGTRYYLARLDFFEFFSRYRQKIRDEGLC